MQITKKYMHPNVYGGVEKESLKVDICITDSLGCTPEANTL